MRPLQLEMEGFGAFREATEIDFRDIDLVALVGATGSGKSTVIDAITFALYGSVARYDDNKIVAPVIHQTSTRARVRLDFEFGGRTYTAARLVQRTATGATTKEARLERDGDVLAADARGMTRAVEELLGLDADQFNRTVVLPQGRFAAFLHDSPANRQATLRQLLGFGMYQSIGQAARQRCATARDQIEVLQPDVDESEGELTDEHRAELATRVHGMGEVRERFAAEVKVIAGLSAESAELTARLARLDGHIGLLAGIRMPDELGDLDRRLGEAVTRRDKAATALTDARRGQQDALSAVAAGPDLVVCRGQLAQRRSAAELEDEQGAVLAELTSAIEAADSARLTADAIGARQRELDAAVEHARELEQHARATANAGPNPAQLASWVQMHHRRAVCAGELAAAKEAEATARATLDPLAVASEAALAKEEAARQHVDGVRQRLGAVAYAGLLVVGKPCPLCQQEVRDLPAHDLDREMRRAEDEFAAASAERGVTEAQRKQAQKLLLASAADVKAQGSALAAIDRDLVGVAPADALGEEQLEAERLRAGVDSQVEAVRQAVAEATTHRSDPANVATIDQASTARDRATGLSARADDIAARLAKAHAALADVPDEVTLTAAITEAARLADVQREANELLVAAESEREAAAGVLDAIQAEVRTAGQLLAAARDGVATLGPPMLTHTRVLADWRQLSVWADERKSLLDTERTQVDADRTKLQTHFRQAEEDARRRCASVLNVDTEGVDLAALRERLVIAETEARGTLDRFDERREKLAELRERIAGLRTSAEVAEKLGHLLRADGFESWLMSSALEGLVDEASVQLRELSGGQFSLVLDDRTFAVRDHANADEVRSARTLSGGETFLASLSLALALADATAELAPEGAPTIESIFLDEGFGTLDPQALDTVATAIEELGATGRMVGIVTHIRELADRMPVRLEVAKTATTSTVERVEV